MKKLIALTLMVACLACFSLGCKKDTPSTGGGSSTTTTQPTDGGTGTDAPTEDTPTAPTE